MGYADTAPLVALSGQGQMHQGSHTDTAVTDPHGFRWVGQSFASCDGCGQPYWEHDYDERPGPGSRPFNARWVYVPITDEQKAAVKARWQAND
jgi:hypothetical protein